MGRSQVSICALLLASAFVSISCKLNSEPKKQPEREVSVQDAELASAQGFFLQDSKSLSGQLVRIVRGSDLFGPSVGQGVLISNSVALVPGINCGDEGLSLVFSSQTNEPPDSADRFGGVVRPVKKCETFDQVAEEKLQADANWSNKISAARGVLAAAEGFTLSRVEFGEGLPQGKEPKWAPVSAHHAESKSVAESFSAWKQLAGKSVFWAGFTKDQQSARGPVARRVWFPFRVVNPQTDDPTQLIRLEPSFSEGDRSPLGPQDAWAEGPEKHLLPGFIFSGVTRFPNIRAFTEIEPVSPTLLCFVVRWKEFADAPIAARFSPECIDASLLVSILR